MTDHVYKIVEVVGTSRINMEDAINTAIKNVGKSEKNLRWFELVETRGQIENGEVAYWQVTVRVGVTAA
ncbi:dodecin domain-containing protein [bacterium]|nr:dodecin domain-containing protein [bacterium]